MTEAGLADARGAPAAPAPDSLPLTDWMGILDAYLDAGQLDAAATVLRGLLAQRPQHLAAYERAMALTWQARQFAACHSFARRVLQADPLNRTAYSVLAKAAERQPPPHGRAAAAAAWQRLWQMHPFNADFRAQWRAAGGTVELDVPALGFIHMHSHHWREAARVFAELTRRDPAREDWRVAWLIATWRSYRRQEALDAARKLVDANRHLLAGWHVLSLVGEPADQAVAQTYIALLDPDGSFTQTMLGLGFVPAGSTVPQLQAAKTNRMLRRYLHGQANAGQQTREPAS